MTGVALNRALSKLGILSRTQATEAILAGRIRVNGRVITDPAHIVVPERARIAVDDTPRQRSEWRTVLLHKPRATVTTRRDPEGRPTVYDLVGGAGPGLNAVGRLDLATTGLLLLTTDTQLANWITDPANAVPRVYVVTARGEVTEEQAAALRDGVVSGHERLRAAAVTCHKASRRESHLIVELREGKNREVRRLFEAIGHEVTRLKRVSLGGLELGDLAPGRWRDVTRDELSAAFPRAPVSRVDPRRSRAATEP
jgi:23S rRNA pseudouridine2605 synthase